MPSSPEMPRAPSAGRRMKKPAKKTMAIAMVTPIALLPTRSSSGTCWFADHERAFIPSDSDSARLTTPRTSGTLDQRSAHRGASCTSTSMSPSGVRTATAHAVSPRIITPSTTACPPMYRGWSAMRCSRSARRLGGLLLGLGALGVAALEALDPAARVHQLLLAGVEGVALRAELDAELGHGRAGDEFVAARAVHAAFDVSGVGVGLHDQSSLRSPPNNGPTGRVIPGREARPGGLDAGGLGDLGQELVVAGGGPQL